MERLYYSGKWYLTHLRLYYCCWFVPLRIGLFIIGYLTIPLDLYLMTGIVDDSVQPTALTVQAQLMGNFSKPIPVLTYAIELGLNVVLLCGLHNNDMVLMQVYLYYSIFAVVFAVLTYGSVLAALDFKYKLQIIVSALFQIYHVFLVRSEIVSMKIKRKIYELSTGGNRSTNISYKYLNNDEDDTLIVLDGNEDKKYKDTKATEIQHNQKYVAVQKDGKETDKIYRPKENEIKVDVESKDNVIENTQDIQAKEAALFKKAEEKRIKKEKKAEEKRIREQMKQEKKRMKDEQRAEEKRLKEAQKAEEKKNKEEQKAEEKRLKEEKKNQKQISNEVEEEIDNMENDTEHRNE